MKNNTNLKRPARPKTNVLKGVSNDKAKTIKPMIKAKGE